MGEFGSWTADLNRIAEWLKSCGVKTVVMQPTGVCWIGVYDGLERAGLDAWLSNARDTKNLPGRKSAVQESQWLMKLHTALAVNTYGLLRNSFRPPQEIRAVRTIWRLRHRHVGDAGREIQHMQKALTTMNVQLANVISDIGGETGQAIIRGIVQGQRDPRELARLKDYRIWASEGEIACSLEGNWREEVLFELRQAVDRYDFCQRQIAECDQRLQKCLAALPGRTIVRAAEPAAESGPGSAGGEDKEGCQGKQRSKKKKRIKPRYNEPKFDLQAELTRICGVDLSAIDGVKAMTIQTFVSGLGTEMSRLADERSFGVVAEAGPQPADQRRQGDRTRTKQDEKPGEHCVANRQHSERQRELSGCPIAHLRTRPGPGKAIKAMAAYLARLIYRMLTRGQVWVDRGVQEHEKRRVEREKQALRRKAISLGHRLEPAA